MAQVRQATRAVRRPGRAVQRVLQSFRSPEPPSGKPPKNPRRDVWTRVEAAPKYRRRAIILLLINSLLFVALGCFTFWLRTGEPTPFISAEYWTELRHAFRPIGPQQVTLIDFLVYPISVRQVPMQIVVLGLLLASLVSIPILVAILYRFPASLIFTATVAFVAIMPWLAITLTLACLLTSLRPFRLAFRYATALLALLPVSLYFFTATRDPSASGMGGSPMETAELYAPWVLALVSSCVLMGIVLIISRLVNDRPGAIAPLLAVMFAVPWVIFETQVGHDELSYRLLERRYAPNSSFFKIRDAQRIITRAALGRVKAQGGDLEDLGAAEQAVKMEMEAEFEPLGPESTSQADRLMTALQAHQNEAKLACERFLAAHLNSRYIPNVLYIMGQVLDTRVDIGAFKRSSLIRYYREFPSESRSAKQAWGTLVERFPDSPIASVAYRRLAITRAREGKIDEAIQLLDQLAAHAGAWGAGQESPGRSEGRWAGLFAREDPMRALDLHPMIELREGRKLRGLLANNRDPHLRRPVVAELLRLDPRSDYYRSNLEKLLADHPLTRLRDNVELFIILTQRSRSLKIPDLEKWVRRHRGKRPPSDAIAQALFELGAAYKHDERWDKAREKFEQVSAEFADSPWAEDAREQSQTLARVYLPARP